MKATIEFNLPEEKEEFVVATKASEYLAAIEEFSNFLRSERKYKNLSEENYKYLETLTDHFHGILKQYNVD